MQTPQIEFEVLYDAVDWDGITEPIFKELGVIKYDKWGHEVYSFLDLFHNMQLTVSEYDEQGHHIKTTIRDMLSPDEEPIVTTGELEEVKHENQDTTPHHHITTLPDGSEIESTTEYLDTDKYGNWTLMKTIDIERKMYKGQERKTVRTCLLKRGICYYDEP